MACHDPPWCVFLFITVLVGGAAAADDQSKTLLKFKQSLSNAGALSNWKDSTPPCKDGENNWSGVICAGSKVFGLQLENMELSGNIDFDTLARLPDLRTISFMNNKFTGKLPAVKKLGALKALYLSNNAFTGEIPDDEFAGMLSLKKVLLAKNKFTGKIPASLTKLPKLMELRLEGNQFQGQIPDFQQKELKTFDVSNNLLEGPIPPGLSKMDKNSFAGNKDVCGGPMGACNTPKKPEEEPSKNTSNDNNSSDNNSSKKQSPVVIIIVVIVVVLALVGIIVGIILFRRKRQPSELVLDAPAIAPSTVQKKSKAATSQELERMEAGAGAGAGSPEHSSGSGKKGGDNGKLSFVRDDRERFDLPDLLRASAEILGSGCFGSSYKANLLSGAMVVVKRYRQMNNVGKEEFQEHMRRLGRLRHPNLLPLVAYYYRKEEKLLVSDFVERGSLAVHLHGNHAKGQPSLDWPTRLKIVKGVAKGLSYLNTELPSLIAPHGHLKSSNVLLDKSFEPLLNDYGLLPVINLEHAQELMVAYKSPEYNQHKRLNKKTDVWSLGILIIEILTGKFPAGYLQKGKGIDDTDLATWVNSVVLQGDGHVFDKEMGSTKNCEGEMTKLLKIGLSCCEFDVDKRWDFKEAIERIEELRDKDGDDEFYSVYTDEGDTHSRGLSDDFSSVKNF